MPAIFAALLAVVLVLLAAPTRAQDVAAGEQTFRKCVACHSLQAGQQRVGPSLGALVGRTAGTQQGFSYSLAMRQSGVTWSRDSLDKFLQSPSHFMHGTKMLFTGLRDAQDRANVIAYIEQAARPATAAAQATPAAPGAAQPARPAAPTQAAGVAAAPPAPATNPLSEGIAPNLRFTLRSGISEGRMVYIGMGGDIDGKVNPPLQVHEGDVVQITLINGEGAEHDIVFDQENVRSQHVLGKGAATTVAFRAKSVGESSYYCSLPGHREAGMAGKLVVMRASEPRTPVAAAGPDISQDPAQLPRPIGARAPERVKIALESVELEGRLADGTTYNYWTFNGKVPGPFLRVRVGDTVEVTLKNDKDASMMHSVDFHAATGPGGGAVHTQVDPGEEKKFEFKALAPGIYVYHCATPMVAHHIANGMYGLILVEPEGGLPPVDREFYVMQGEIYTQGRFGDRGSQEFSVEKLLDEKPEYVVFNGSVGALTALHPMHARVGETVRIYFGVGGPNLTSSFHVIGEIFDRVYMFGDLVSQPGRSIQTVSVPAGGAVAVEFKVDYPGRYLLVDHALSRLERGLVGFLIVEGTADPAIYKAYSPATAGGH